MQGGKETLDAAKVLFSGGVTIDRSSDDPIAETKAALVSAQVIFGAVFECDGKRTRIDILQKGAAGWILIDVKASKSRDKISEEWLEEIAYPVTIAKESGLNVERIEFMLLSSDYRMGNGAPLFERKDVTEDTLKLLALTQIKSAALLRAISDEDAPPAHINTCCKECGFLHHCAPEISESDIIFLHRISAKQVSSLRASGINRIGEISGQIPLNGKQALMVRCFKEGRDYAGDGLASCLLEIAYPICFLDFETTKWAVPTILGTEPYQQIPFQWSCDILERQGGELRHYEYLHTSGGDPRPFFAGSLIEVLGVAGTIMVYSSFEKTVLKRLAVDRVPHAEELLTLFEERGVDLLKMTEEHVFMRTFKGSWSIKTVLPGLIPEMSYNDLVIRDGEAAAAEYRRMLESKTSPEEAAAIAQDLLRYCRRDTEAMHSVFTKLLELGNKKAPPAAALQTA